jgi:hypothetical protein
MDKKYELIKNSKDNYTLKYKDRSIDFKTDVALISEMQGINKKARINMIKDLSKEGISMKSLSIEEKKDGKTYIDNTNKEELENAYLEEAMTKFFDDICKRYFNMGLAELLVDMDLTEDTKQVEQFTTEFISALTGQTPSGR